MRQFLGRSSAVLAAIAFAFAGVAAADEGMWTFDAFPADKMRATHGWAPDQAWLDRVRMGSARLQSGCSSAIVSGSGLVQTNHHCVVDCVQNLSKPGEDLVQTGFAAATTTAERVCPGLAVETLGAISDVTKEISAATAGKSGEAFTKARDAEIAKLEKACKADVADRRCQVVTLFQGGQYKLYAYKRYEDVRLAFAPELNAAFFGGDPDNFNFPRYALDAAFLRLYENGKPAVTPNHLKWRSAPLTDGEVVMVSGNPGSTSRAFTMDQLAFQRDHMLPWRLKTLSEMRGRLLAFSALSPENARIASDTLFGVENSFKALSGRRLALVDPGAQAAIAARENDLRTRIRADAAQSSAVGDAYAQIAAATAAYRRFYLAHQYLEARPGGGSDLIGYARTLVQGAAERGRPDAERLPAFTDARLPATQRALLADRPIEPALEEILISFWASKMREYLTADDPLVIKALGKESPEALAKRIASQSRLGDAAVRKALWEGGAAAIAASTDPAIVLFRALDADARALRARYNAEVEAPISRAQNRIATARFALLGASTYPDATFTLRLSYGTVKGWTEPSGRAVAPFTRFAGLFDRATGQDPFKLVPAWAGAQAKLDPTTIFNVSSTNDIIGGNSGSPLIDKEGRVVGAVFDGNIHSLGGEYVYDGALNRTVSVASTAIEEALVKVYGQQALVDELTASPTPQPRRRPRR